MSSRTKYSPEFKHEAIPLIQLRVVCKYPWKSASSPTYWSVGAKKRMSKRKGRQGLRCPREEEFGLLKRELARAKKEPDFLREAADFFAKRSP